MEAKPKRYKILEPEKEERRVWVDKKAGRDPHRTRSAHLFFCDVCHAPINPDTLIVDRDPGWVCPECGKKERTDLYPLRSR